jgi:hypothetical protein
MTNIDAFKLYCAIKQIEATNTAMHWKLAYAFAKNLSIIESSVKAYDAGKKAIFYQYPMLNEEGTVIHDNYGNPVANDCAELRTAMEQLAMEEIAVDYLKTVSLEDVNLNLTIEQAIALQPMLIEC